MAASSVQSLISRFRIAVRVTKTYYHGRVKIERLQGFYNVSDNSVTTKQMATGPINMDEVIQNWEIVPEDELPTKAVGFEFHIADDWLFNESVRLLPIREIRQVTEANFRT